MSTSPEIVLASSSPRRRALLSEMGLSFSVRSPDVDELANHPDGPHCLALENARLKGIALSRRRPDALVIASDTVVALGDQVYGKPRDLDHAAAMLRALSGKAHSVISSVALFWSKGGLWDLFAETTTVRFRAIDEALIRSYLSKTQPLDKAGGYGIQDHGDELVASIEGSFHNVVGLPTERLRSALQRRFPDLLSSGA